MQAAAQSHATIPHFQSFPSQEALAKSLAAEVGAALREAIEKRGIATLVVSGGSTPKPFFSALQKEEMDWSSLLVTVADERWVSNKDSQSNEKLVRENLLKKGARFVSLYNAAPTPMAGEEAAEEALRHMLLPFDVTILGMGPDGHTASLFPGNDRLEDALESTQRLCLGIENAPKAPSQRITLTRNALIQSRRLMLHITGADKLKVLEAAMKPGSASDLPIRAFLHQDDVPLEIYWAE